MREWGKERFDVRGMHVGASDFVSHAGELCPKGVRKLAEVKGC